MKKNYLLLFFLFTGLNLFAQFSSQNINLLGIFNDSTVVAESVYGIRYQACWGWVNQNTGREYGIIGSTAGTYIIDVSDPVHLVQTDYIPHRQQDCIWHEYKTYGNYLYIISDDAGNNSMQIVDMSTLPDSATVVYDSNSLFVHSHTLTIEGDKLYVGSVTTATDFSSMNVYSLSDPVAPALLRRLDQDYPMINHVHDMFVINDTIFASCGYDGLYIFRYDTVMNKFNLLGNLQDGFNNYNHSSIISPDHQSLYLCEEVPDGRPVKIIDISDIHNPVLDTTFYSHVGATPHNPDIKNNLLIMAYYQDGVYVYNIDDQRAPVMTGFFDTYPANPSGTYTQPAYAGCWSVYSGLPSGILLAGDMQSGLFTLDISPTTGITKNNADRFLIYPNPANNIIHLSGFNNKNKCSIKMNDISGREVYSGIMNNNTAEINSSELNPGIYFVTLSDNLNISVRKIEIVR